MQIPDLAQLEDATRKIVREGKQTGQLSVLTPRIIRSKVEELFALAPGTLDDKVYKDALKQVASDEALRDDDKPRVDEHSDSMSHRPKKRKSDTQDNVKPEKSAKVTKALPTSNKSSKNFKSAETIQSSDEEDNGGGEGDEPLQTAYMRGSQDQQQSDDDDCPEAKGDVDQSQDKRHQPAGFSDVTAHSHSPSTAKQEPIASAESLAEEKITESDSELSVLLDEPPKAKKKSKSKDKDPPKSKSTSSKQKKSTVELSKDDKTIARMKSLVLACGTRKVWVKEFEKFPKPSQQIKRLKEILTELGMTGRFTLHQAKLIKEKRELAQELEDVQEFQRQVASSATRKKAKPLAQLTDDESTDEIPVKRKPTARQSIMAFLGDESE